MNDPRTQQPLYDSGDPADSASRANMSETLQQALRSLSGDRSALAGGALTQETVTELARRAGLNTPAQVAELARMMGVQTGSGPADATPQHIVFQMGDVECAFPAATVQGVERVGDVATVPNTVPWVIGIIHLRGAILSVVDLRTFFGLPEQPLTTRSRLLVVTIRDMTIAFVVDGVTEMRPLDDAHLGATPIIGTPGWAADYAEKTVNIEGRTVILLDPERLLFADKMHHYRADFS